MKNVIILNKKEGETPLSALENFRKKNPKYLNVPMTYAGRLDPMASGVLVVLADEEIKNKEKYLNLNKEYNFSVLFGFRTDTYDILGKVVETSLDNDSILGSELFFAHQQAFLGEGILPSASLPSQGSKSLLPRSERVASLIKNNLKYFKGNIKQKYPIYSSKTVNGKQLFSYARSGKDVEIPERDIFIKNIILKKVRKINNKDLFLNIERRIKKVKGDFRQEEILNIWKKKLTPPQNFYIADLAIKCSSGTYVRAIANLLGEKMKIPALAFSIKRTKVGKFFI